MVPAAGDKYNDFDIILIFFLRSLPSTSLLQCRTPWSTSGCSTFLSADRRTFGGVVSESGLAAAPSARAPQPPPAAAQSMVDRGCCTTPPRRPCPPPRTRRRGRPSQRSPRRGSAGAVTSTSFWPISRALLSSTPAHTHTPCAMLGVWCPLLIECRLVHVIRCCARFPGCRPELVPAQKRPKLSHSVGIH